MRSSKSNILTIFDLRSDVNLGEYSKTYTPDITEIRKQTEIDGSCCRCSNHPRLVLDNRLDEGD